MKHPKRDPVETNHGSSSLNASDPYMVVLGQSPLQHIIIIDLLYIPLFNVRVVQTARHGVTFCLTSVSPNAGHINLPSASKSPHLESYPMFHLVLHPTFLMSSCHVYDSIFAKL